MQFVAAITFKITGGRKHVYSMAAANTDDMAFMVTRFFEPAGLFVKFKGGFATQEDATKAAAEMFARAEAKHGRVPVAVDYSTNPMFIAALEA